MENSESTAQVVATIADLNALSVGDVVLCADKSVHEVVLEIGRAGSRNILRGFDGGREVIVSRIKALLPATVIHRRAV